MKEEWAVRRSLWMAMHFRPYVIRTESQKDVRLWRIKEKVLKLLGEDSKYCTHEYHVIHLFLFTPDDKSRL